MRAARTRDSPRRRRYRDAANSGDIETRLTSARSVVLTLPGWYLVGAVVVETPHAVGLKPIVRATRVADLDSAVVDDMSNASTRRGQSRAKASSEDQVLELEEYQPQPQASDVGRRMVGSEGQTSCIAEAIPASASRRPDVRLPRAARIPAAFPSSVDDFSSPRSRRDSRRLLIDASRGVGSGADFVALENVEVSPMTSSLIVVPPGVASATQPTLIFSSQSTDPASSSRGRRRRSRLRDRRHGQRDSARAEEQVDH